MTREVLGYVFGYGSLADPNDWLIVRDAEGLPPSVYGHVAGYRRHWDLAADNADPEHDHKYHADSGSGDRPDIKVATLGLELVEGVRVNGRAVPVDAQRLEWFDQREGRLYDRTLVDRPAIEMELESGLDLWAYMPKTSAQATFAEGLADGDAFLPRYYKEWVERVFQEIGPEAWADFEASTRSPTCPVRDLDLIRAPGDAGI